MQWLRQPPLRFEPQLIALTQFAQGMSSKKSSIGTLPRRLMGHCLGPLLAKLHRRATWRIRPGAARTIDAPRMIEATQSRHPLEHIRSRQRAANTPQSPPAPSRFIISPDEWHTAIRRSHRSPRTTYPPGAPACRPARSPPLKNGLPMTFPTE